MMLPLLLAACVAVLGPKVTAHELAQAVSGFTPGDPNTVLAYAPAPGVQRIVHAPELRAWLRQAGWTGDTPLHDTPLQDTPLQDACFARPVAPLEAAAVIAAMQRTVGTGAAIEVVELSHAPVPAGELVFPREGLGTPPVALWHGYVRYDGESKFSIWARVKVVVPVTRVIARADFLPGTPIAAGQIELLTSPEFPDGRRTPPSLKDTAGCMPRRLIPAGTPVWQDALDPPLAVVRGDKITVGVQSGLARLSVVAEAQANGRRGDWIAVKNLESGKTFRARVDADGRASVNGAPLGKP